MRNRGRDRTGGAIFLPDPIDEGGVRGRARGRRDGRGQSRGYRRNDQRQGGRSAKATLELDDEEDERSFFF